MSGSVIGLDDHDFKVHRGKGRYQFTAVAKSFQTLCVGVIPNSSNGQREFLRKFQSLFNKRRQKSGDERSAAGGRQGHQKTPAFIHAVMLQALKLKCDEEECEFGDELPRGGFTDVGLHTGGEKRDTCFPLVNFVFQFMINNQSDIGFEQNISFDALEAHFYMYLLEMMVIEFGDKNALDEDVLIINGTEHHTQTHI